MTAVTNAVLIERATLAGRAHARRRLAALAVLIVGFALLTWAGARISVKLPFTPVPGTLQTLAVLLAGGLLGARVGAASQTLYLMMGIAGLPVFALPGAGPGYLLGPTGGFLAGFVVAAWTTGVILNRTRPLGVFGLLLSYLAGSVSLYLCGLIWLALIMGGDLRGALQAGLAPFVLFDLAKIVVASGVHLGCARLGFTGRGAWKNNSPR